MNKLFFRILIFTSIIPGISVPVTARSQSVPRPTGASPHRGAPDRVYDICVYGGTSAGVIAAYTAARMHRQVILIEPGQHPGGLSSGGLGYTDIGNKYAIGGLSLDFYRRAGQHYGKVEQWIFEPHVAEDIFRQYIQEGRVRVVYGYQITDAVKDQGTISSIRLSPAILPASPAATAKTSSPSAVSSASPHRASRPQPIPSLRIRARMFIDCSYEGDLMARAGVSFTIGREANKDFNETYNGVQLRDKHQFPDSISPYKTPGDPASGLLWGISDQPLSAQGTGDNKVQSYNYRICLTNDPANRIPITQPADYDPARYELLLRLLEKKPAKDLWAFLKFDLLPGHKTDINNNGAFSTDMIGMNYDYPAADYPTRARIAAAHTSYCQGLLYFIGHDPRMPEHLRKKMLDWGYPKDEYRDNQHWTPQLYVRESRRMKGEYIMTQANCEGREKVQDGIGLAAYTMDSHNCQRIVVNGMVKNEGDVQIGGFPPYPISYRSLVPKAGECNNLLVPVCLSATHIAYGSIRMEPVFMELGQAAAIAAASAIDQRIPVQEVDAAYIRNRLKTDPLADGSTPQILADNDDSTGVTIQGDWIREQYDSYGFSRLTDNYGDNLPRSVTFTPQISKAGEYTLYVYVPKVPHPSTTTLVIVNASGKEKEFRLPTGSLQVEGQTSGEWVPAGKLSLTAGSETQVTISNKGADGTIIADAILLIPVKNQH